MDPTIARENNLIEAWCLVLTGDPGGAWRGGTKIPHSSACVMMVLAKVDENGDFYKQVGIADAEAKQTPYWWETSGKVMVTVL